MKSYHFKDRQSVAGKQNKFNVMVGMELSITKQTHLKEKGNSFRTNQRKQNDSNLFNRTFVVQCVVHIITSINVV